MAADKSVKKVVLLGSGALKIGEAGEFDYSGSQAIKALKEEGIKIILINPNIATIQTSEEMADRVYFLPVTPEFVSKVIQKEKPDSILLGFGGQTALNCGIGLFSQGILKASDVRVLGTPVQAIINTEDRAIFVRELNKINIKTARSAAVSSTEEALVAAGQIGYPVMVRAAFALGGKGSGHAKDKEELAELAEHAFSHSPQILIEEYLGGWKEIEYEVVRDRNDNCITVCNMENFDPMGVHTGDSIVVAPSQTLTNHEYHMLREISIKTIRHLGIIGECNIQYALDPNSDEYRVIEVNARLSRSSALASKATGYPLAYVAAKLALGYTLDELSNSITKSTKAAFEPALDYIVVKIPRWDLQKFSRVAAGIGSEMKSVGEVMAIGRKFEEAVQKAIRMLDTGRAGIISDVDTFPDLDSELANPSDRRIFAIGKALLSGYSIERIASLTRIDPWFISKLKNITDLSAAIKGNELTKEALLEAKQLGFSDSQIARLRGMDEKAVRAARMKWKVLPCVKQIDTLAAEFPAKTNYLYTTYNGSAHDVEFPGDASVIVLGSGSYRIGSSVEFDWCCVNSIRAARKEKYRTIMINCNPETVSTDYDEADSLYFEELTFETVLNIYELERPSGIILSMGGQIPNNLAMKLKQAGVKVLGTAPVDIDKAEDRNKFSKLCDTLHIDQPEWKELTSLEKAKEFVKEVAYPVIIRPSYVLSGAAMSIIYDDMQLAEMLGKASVVSAEYPVVISKFVQEAKEIEIDAVSSKGEILAYAITEHIENAGVHSGDAHMVLPAQKLYVETMRRILTTAKNLASALRITGPFNIQFLAKDNSIKVIECNLRASRSFPFVSKVLKINFIELATRAILSCDVKKIEKSFLDIDYVAVKAPQFSYSRLKGAFPKLGVEMGSTGEVACFGENVEEAFLKSIISTGFMMPKKSILLSISGDKNRFRLLEPVAALASLGFTLYATQNTHKFYSRYGIRTQMLYKIHEKRKPNILEYLIDKKIDLVMHIEQDGMEYKNDDSYIIRRNTIDFSIPLVTNIQVAKVFASALVLKPELAAKAWDEYR